jgi:methylmalonyl-CoA mutase
MRWMKRWLADAVLRSDRAQHAAHPAGGDRDTARHRSAGGSYFVEALTQSLAAAAERLIAEVEELGGMTRAVETGMPKLRIEEAAARGRRASIARGGHRRRQQIRRTTRRKAVELLDIDNSKVARSRFERLARVRAGRNPVKVQAALDALTVGATDRANLTGAEQSRQCGARATVGEVSDALEKVFQRHRATTRCHLRGEYGSAMLAMQHFNACARKCAISSGRKGVGRAFWLPSSVRMGTTAARR